jgi:capsular exopolysaccharide synthesis family protein
VELSRYVASVVGKWRQVVAATLLGGALAFAWTQVETPRYTVDTQLFVSAVGASDPSTAAQGGQFSQDRTASYAQLVVGRQLATEVIEALGLDMRPTQLMSLISVQVLPETVILEVVVTDTDPARAQAIAESIGSEFADLVERVETPQGSAAPPVQVSVVAAPELPTEPSSPKVPLAVAAGLAVGLLLGAGIAVVRDRLDTSVRSEDDAVAASGSPVLGVVPVDRRTSGETTSDPVMDEAFRILRANLTFATVDRKPRTLMITSALQGEGKSTTAIQLAEALSHGGAKVVLVEGDLRRPRITRYLGLVGGVGLTNVLTDSVKVDEVLQRAGNSGLKVLGAGPTPPNPGELLGSAAMSRVLSDLTERFDLVVIDAPPLLPVADAAALAALCDGVLLCVRWGGTPRHDVERSQVILDRARADTLGCVLTFAPAPTGGYSDYHDRSRAPVRGRRGSRWRRQGVEPTPVPLSGLMAPGRATPVSRP